METKTNKLKKLLGYLVELQTNTAPIELSIGYTDETNFVNHEVVVVKNCPPAIFDVIASWKEVNKEIINKGLLLTPN